MYSIVMIRGGLLDSISTPNKRAAYRAYMNAVRNGYITRLWKADKSGNTLIL